MKTTINQKKTPPRIKMILAIAISFIAVVTISPTLFLANTPRINPQFISDVGLIPARIMAFIQNPLNTDVSKNTAQTAQAQPTSEAENLNYTPISQNVQAAEDPVTKVEYIKILKGTTVEVHTVKFLDGRTVTIYVPQ